MTCGIISSIEQSPFSESSAKGRQFKVFLNAQLELLIKKGHCHEFISGLYRGPETFAAEAVLALRETYPDITFWGILESEEQWTRWPESDRERFFNIMLRADYEYRASNAGNEDSRQLQLRTIAEEADMILAVFSNPATVRGALRYAIQRGKPVLHLDPVLLAVSQIDIL